MTFLANENFPNPSIRVLREAGYDVTSVREERPSISDVEVVKWANDTGKVILTFDKDYGEIVFRYKIFCSVVFFRQKGNDPEHVGKELLKIVEHIVLEGYFTVIDNTGVRQRELKF